MGLRLRHDEWQRHLRRFLTNPVTEILAIVALVLVAFVTLVVIESRLIASPEAPVVFSPK
ncbi:MAG: hypothetical protein AB7P08_15820 [Burkholderiales bacterium]